LLQIHAFHNENYVRKHTPVTDGNGVLIVVVIRICSKNIIYQTYKKSQYFLKNWKRRAKCKGHLSKGKRENEKALRIQHNAFGFHYD